jgi:UDP-glucose 4-epimerase
MRILVTGGAGIIRQHIAEHFQHLAEVYVLDDLRSGFSSNLSGLDCQLIVGLVLFRDLVREAMKGIDFLFHPAAKVSVQGSAQKPNEYAEINVRGTAIVAARHCAQQLSFQERHSRHLQSRPL